MAMSAAFIQAGQSVRTFDGAVPVIQLSDFHLLRLWETTANSLTVKEQYLQDHNFPEHGSRWLKRVQDEIAALQQRLKLYTDEKKRRGL